jgi:hypothetical protein
MSTNSGYWQESKPAGSKNHIWPLPTLYIKDRAQRLQECRKTGFFSNKSGFLASDACKILGLPPFLEEDRKWLKSALDRNPLF